MKSPLARIPPEDGLPDYRDAHHFFGEIWVKYPLATNLVCYHLLFTYNPVDKPIDPHLSWPDFPGAHQA
jgi:hypothetical protein